MVRVFGEEIEVPELDCQELESRERRVQWVQ